MAEQVRDRIAARSTAGPAGLSAPVRVEVSAGLAQIRALRELVWCNETELVDLQRFDPANAERLGDAHDAGGLHWVIMAGDECVAAARLTLCDARAELPGLKRFGHLLGDLKGPYAALNRMVVHPRFRRRGLSRALTEVRLAAARAAGAAVVLVDAVPNRIAPLRQLGFADLGLTVPEPWDRIDVRLMALPLSA